MADTEIFDDMYLEVMKEIGNIGAGNAVTSLAKMMNMKVDMRVPRVKLYSFQGIAQALGDPEDIVYGILVNASGDINGMMMFLFKKDSAKILIDNLLGSYADEEEDFSEIKLSALMEIGNIIASAYLNALSTMINKKIVPSVPSLAIDMAGALLSVPAIESSKIADSVLFIESVFETDDQEVSGFFILFPDMPSYEIILQSLGVM